MDSLARFQRRTSTRFVFFYLSLFLSLFLFSNNVFNTFIYLFISLLFDFYLYINIATNKDANDRADRDPNTQCTEGPCRDFIGTLDFFGGNRRWYFLSFFFAFFFSILLSYFIHSFDFLPSFFSSSHP